MAENPTVSNYELLLELGSLIASSGNFNLLLSCAIEKICNATGCSMAEAWFYQPTMQALVLHDVYVPENEKDIVTHFYEYTQKNNYMRGKGLPDYVWGKSKAEWVEEVYHKPYFFRREYARKSGIHTAFAVPIATDGQVKAVMSFYRRSMDAEDTGLIGMLTIVAELLSRAFTNDRLINQLNETELRFWNIFNSSPDSIVIADQRGFIVFANPASEAMFMYKPDELIGRSLQVLMPDDYKEAHQRGLERYTATGETRAMNHTLELEGIRKDGTIFPLELSLATWIHNEQRYYSGILRDRTQSMQNKTKLQAKIHDLDTIIYRLSHDLRGPLTTIKGIEYHAREDLKDPQALEYFDLIQQSSDTLDKKLRQLNIIAGISQDTLEYTRQDIHSLIFNILDTNKSMKEADGLSFKLNVRPGEAAYVDKKLLYHILDKLIKNAIKYRRNTDKDQVLIAADIAEDHISFVIEDNGCGIDDGQLDKVFDLFYRANDTTDGTGLGLFIVKQAMEKLNGQISIESVLGKGTIVRLTVPVPSA